jgi:acid phosphatase (class A)
MAYQGGLMILILLLQVFSFADWTEIKPQDFSVEAPPAVGTRIDHQDYLQLLEYQENRTEEQCKLAKQQWIPYFEALFQFSGAVTKDEATLAKPIINQVMKLTEKVTDHYKKLYAKERPYDRFPEVQPCIKKVSGKTSYPSSHAALGTTAACVLAEIFPAKKGALLEHGWDIGELRVIAGVHHPSDVEAGREVGKEICDSLKKQKDFMQALKELQ